MDLAVKEKLSLSAIKKRIKEIQQENASNTKRTSTKNLKAEFKAITKIQSEAWNDDKKKAKIESLLKQLKKILEVKAT